MAPSVLKAAALALRAVSIICPSQPTCPEDDGCSYQAPDGTDLTFSCAESSVVSRDVEISARAVSVTCPTLPTCPQNDQCTFTANEVSFQIDCATDFYGGDLQLARASTLTACMTACSESSACVAASYTSGRKCYLKSIRNKGVTNENVTGIAITSRKPGGSMPIPAQTCPKSFTCPVNNGCLYSSGSRTLALSCGVDFYGGDYDNHRSESLEACTQSCGADSKCVASSFVDATSRCYLKNTKHDPNFDDHVNAVQVVAMSQCSTINSGTNYVANPGFETGGASWDLISRAYFWTYAPAAHCGQGYMILGPDTQSPIVAASQKIATQLDTKKHYNVIFNYAPRQSSGAPTCVLTVHANGATIWSKTINDFNDGPYIYQTYAASFAPTSPEVTLKFELACSVQGSGYQSAYIFLDDVSLAPA